MHGCTHDSAEAAAQAFEDAKTPGSGVILFDLGKHGLIAMTFCASCLCQLFYGRFPHNATDSWMAGSWAAVAREA